MHYHIDMITHGPPLLNQSSAPMGQVDNMLVDLHLSVTNGWSRAQAWTAHFTDGDDNHYAISPSPGWEIRVGACDRHAEKLIRFRSDQIGKLW